MSYLWIETPVSDYSYFCLCHVFLMRNHKRDSLRLFATVADWRILILVTSAWVTSPEERSSSLHQPDDVCCYWCSKHRDQEQDNIPSAPETISIETATLKRVSVAFQIELWASICWSLKTLNWANPLTRFELVSDPMETDAHLLITHPADCSLVMIGHS